MLGERHLVLLSSADDKTVCQDIALSRLLAHSIVIQHGRQKLRALADADRRASAQSEAAHEKLVDGIWEATDEDWQQVSIVKATAPPRAHPPAVRPQVPRARGRAQEGCQVIAHLARRLRGRGDDAVGRPVRYMVGKVKAWKGRQDDDKAGMSRRSSVPNGTRTEPSGGELARITPDEQGRKTAC